LDGLKINWYPHDIRAMSSLAWANGRSATNYVGGRCNYKNPKTYQNGRLMQQDCFDNNPSTFHLALGNLIGRAKVSFVMDKTFDFEVWNQPVQSYEFTYFNPMDPSKRSKDWKAVAADYNDAFKKRDRFQKPKTRGLRVGNKFDDRGIKKVVGVIASVNYLAEAAPNHGVTPSNDVFFRVNYTYDLELHQQDGKLVALGGEWHSNVHPDFLWLPRKNSIALTNYDRIALDFSATKEPNEKVTKTAKAASGDGYPLCQVLKELVNRSSGTQAYRCAAAE